MPSMVESDEKMEKLFICPACHKELFDMLGDGRRNFLCKNDNCYVYDVVVHRTVKSYVTGLGKPPPLV